MNWGKIRTVNRLAVEDLCNYLSSKYSKKYGVHKDCFVYIYDRNREISVYTGSINFFVPDNHIMDYLSEIWNIYINIMSDLRESKVKRFYLINWMEKNILYATELEGPFDTYDEALIRAFMDCFTVVQRKLRTKMNKKNKYLKKNN
jgi:hypothetical protein